MLTCVTQCHVDQPRRRTSQHSSSPAGTSATTHIQSLPSLSQYVSTISTMVIKWIFFLLFQLSNKSYFVSYRNHHNIILSLNLGDISYCQHSNTKTTLKIITSIVTNAFSTCIFWHSEKTDSSFLAYVYRLKI